MSRPSGFFSSLHLRVGWSVLWRVWLVTLGFELLTIMLVAGVLRAHVEQVRAISSVLVLIGLIPVYHWAGTAVLRKRNLPVPPHFIGWAICWRGLGLAIPGCLGIVLLILVPATAVPPLKRFESVAMVFTLIGGLVWILYSYGWATLRVSWSGDSSDPPHVYENSPRS